jgi:hypothetical protein
MRPTTSFRQRLHSLILLVLLVTTGCSPRRIVLDQAPELIVEFEVEPRPAVVGNARVQVRILSENGEPVDSLSLTIKGDMMHAGMTPILENAQAQGNGIYHASVDWSMAGSWILTLNGTLPDGRQLIRSFSLDVGSDQGK